MARNQNRKQRGTPDGGQWDFGTLTRSDNTLSDTLDGWLRTGGWPSGVDVRPYGRSDEIYEATGVVNAGAIPGEPFDVKLTVNEADPVRGNQLSDDAKDRFQQAYGHPPDDNGQYLVGIGWVRTLPDNDEQPLEMINGGLFTVGYNTNRRAVAEQAITQAYEFGPDDDAIKHPGEPIIEHQALTVDQFADTLHRRTANNYGVGQFAAEQLQSEHDLQNRWLQEMEHLAERTHNAGTDPREAFPSEVVRSLSEEERLHLTKQGFKRDYALMADGSILPHNEQW